MIVHELMSPLLAEPRPPAGVLPLMIGGVMLIGGAVWARRISQGDGEPHSFRSTASRPDWRTRLIAVGAVLLLTSLALVLAARP